MKKQVHAYYTGSVQGVGFRFTAQEAASDLQVKGWVKNLGDGRVEIVAEAEEKALIDFLTRVSQNFRDYIQNTDAEWMEATGEFEDFGIRF